MPDGVITSVRHLALRRFPARPGSLSIVNYHRVLDKPSTLFPGEMYAERFAEQLGWLKKHFNVLSLTDANRLRLAGKLPARALAITFDDGYADNEAVALPILKQTGLSATFFICSQWLNGGVMWNDTVIAAARYLKPHHLRGLVEIVPGLAGKLPAKGSAAGGYYTQDLVSTIVGEFKYLPANRRGEAVAEFAELVQLPAQRSLMMSPRQIAALAKAGMEIGGHTVTHPILANLSHSEALVEMSENRRWLQDITGQPVLSFAYTNGRPGCDYTAISRQAVIDAGFELAVTTAKGVSTQTTDRFQLPRFTPWDKTEPGFVFRLLRNTYQTHPAMVACD